VSASRARLDVRRNAFARNSEFDGGTDRTADFCNRCVEAHARGVARLEPMDADRRKRRSAHAEEELPLVGAQLREGTRGTDARNDEEDDDGHGEDGREGDDYEEVLPHGKEVAAGQGGGELLGREEQGDEIVLYPVPLPKVDEEGREGEDHDFDWDHGRFGATHAREGDSQAELDDYGDRGGGRHYGRRTPYPRLGRGDRRLRAGPAPTLPGKVDDQRPMIDPCGAEAEGDRAHLEKSDSESRLGASHHRWRIGAGGGAQTVLVYGEVVCVDRLQLDHVTCHSRELRFYFVGKDEEEPEKRGKKDVDDYPGNDDPGDGEGGGATSLAVNSHSHEV